MDTELLITTFVRDTQIKHQLIIPNDVILMLLSFYVRCIKFEESKNPSTDDKKAMAANWLINTLTLRKKSVMLSSTVS